MRRLLAVMILGTSLALTASVALAHDSAGIPQRSWDGVVAQNAQLHVVPSDGDAPIAVLTGPGFEGYNPYRTKDTASKANR